MRSKSHGSSVVPPSSSAPEAPEPEQARPVPAGGASGEPPQPEDAPPLPNAFDGTFLARLEGQEEPPTAAEADFAGPWRIEALPPHLNGGFGLFRMGESPGLGYRPFARFADRWLAQLVAALLPAHGRDVAYRLREERDAEGWALESREAWGAVVGHLTVHDPGVVAGLQVLDGLMRSPLTLALFLEACGKTVLERAGAILEAGLEEM